MTDDQTNAHRYIAADGTRDVDQLIDCSKIARGSSPSVIDLFCGAGGMSEGFRQAGFTSLLANDADEMAAKTFAYNHPKTPFIVADIRKVAATDILSKADVGVGQVDVICGGPPCQGFSLAGQRLTDDPRNQLFKEFVRIVDGVRPRFLVFENVPGILSMQGGSVLDAVLSEFRDIGYECDYEVLNAADYGVPQARSRFILIGSREGEHPAFPEATHTASGVATGDLFSSAEKTPHLTAWDALSDLPAILQGEGDDEMLHPGQYLNEYQRSRRGRRQPGALFNHRATSHSDLIIKRYAAIPEGGDSSQIPVDLQTKKTNVFKIHRTRPSRTVTCNHRTDLLHPVHPRGTTVREAARLQSFDDDYRFFGNLTRKARWVTQDDQVGNAVPPLLAKALAEHLRKQIRK